MSLRTHPCPVPVAREGPWGRTCALIAAVTTVMALLAVACNGSQPVDQLTIKNPTSYDLEASVTNGSDDARDLLGRVARGETVRRDLVADQGELWVFRFHHGGLAVGELRLSRAALQKAGWRIEVPQEVERRLRGRGVEPSPRR